MLSPRVVPWWLISAALVSPVLGCSPSAEEHATPAAQAISGGEFDERYSSVFGTIVHGVDGVAGCSATLIAPNLLLTARHCVAPSESRRVICGRTMLGPPIEGRTLMAANRPDLARSSSSDWFRGAEVHVPEEGDDTCGFDIALVILAANIPASVAKPAVPRIDRDVTVDERYVAVGYGLDEAGESGARRQRDDLRVACEPGACGIGVRSSEFIGEAGACEGDSGGPALDLEGRVVGVVSRSGDACESPVYGTVTAWRDLLIRVAERAASLGGYEAPSWVTRGSSEPEPCVGCGGSSSESGGANSSGGRAANGGKSTSGGSSQGGRSSATSESPPGTAGEGSSAEHEPKQLEATCSVARGQLSAHAPLSSRFGAMALASALALATWRRRRKF